MRRSIKVILALATLSSMFLSACSSWGSAASRGSRGSGASGSAQHGAAGTPSASTAPVPIGSPGNPLVLSCGQESSSDPPPPQHARPGDLAVGPLYFVDGNRLATVNPAGYSDHGMWKVALVLTMGSSATVEIAPRGRGQVVISNPYSPAGGIVAATYHSCAHYAGFYPQYFSFLHGAAVGCVPLDIRIGDEQRVRHVTISLGAGSCT